MTGAATAHPRAWAITIVATALLAGYAGCRGEPGTGPSLLPSGSGSAVLVGAGDIGMCGSEGPAMTAALLDNISGTIFATGDIAYFQGSRDDFMRCYHPTWGRHRARTRPTPGNHEYESPGAAPYFEYFGSNAGPAGLGYYRFTLGAWSIFSLNSNAPSEEGSAQLAWLRRELASSSSRCTLAYWHHPLVSSGPNGDHRHMSATWRVLQDFRVDLVIAGHEHSYERFGRLDADGRPSPDGIRQFVVGTGGARLTPLFRMKPGSEERASTWGVLKLTLRSDGYTWEFVSVPSVAYSDRGQDVCQ
jgi:hypothetical protein